MPGLSIVEGAGIDFDAPSGRIAEAYATGNLTPGTVIEFYRATLRQLGWNEVADAAFEREGESLRLDLEDADGELTVWFRLSPVGTTADLTESTLCTLAEHTGPSLTGDIGTDITRGFQIPHRKRSFD